MFRVPLKLYGQAITVNLKQKIKDIGYFIFEIICFNANFLIG